MHALVHTTPVRPRRTHVLVAATVAMAACAAPVEEVHEDPLPSSMTVAFPSVAAAVAVDAVTVDVLEAPETVSCAALVAKRRSHQDLPATVTSTTAHSPCEFVGAGAVPSPVDVPFGRRAFLAVATHQGEEVLIGCSVATLGRDAGPITISLTPFNNLVSIPATRCSALSAHCARGC